MKYNSLFKNGKISMCLFLLLLVIGCAILAVVFPHGTMVVEADHIAHFHAMSDSCLVAPVRPM